jgi:hypothetical protein
MTHVDITAKASIMNAPFDESDEPQRGRPPRRSP